MIWAGTTSHSITSTAGLDECVGKGDMRIRFSPFSAKRAKARKKPRRRTCKTNLIARCEALWRGPRPPEGRSPRFGQRR